MYQLLVFHSLRGGDIEMARHTGQKWVLGRTSKNLK